MVHPAARTAMFSTHLKRVCLPQSLTGRMERQKSQRAREWLKIKKGHEQLNIIIVCPWDILLNIDELSPPSTTSKHRELERSAPDLRRGSSYQLPPSGSKGSALCLYFQPQSSTQKWRKSRESAVPPLPLPRVRGPPSLCAPRPWAAGGGRCGGEPRSAHLTLRLWRMRGGEALTWRKAVFPLRRHQPSLDPRRSASRTCRDLAAAPPAPAAPPRAGSEPRPGPAHRRGSAHVRPPPSRPRGERARRRLRALPSRLLARLRGACGRRGCCAGGGGSLPAEASAYLTALGLVHPCLTFVNSDSVTAVASGATGRFALGSPL